MTSESQDNHNNTARRRWLRRLLLLGGVMVGVGLVAGVVAAVVIYQTLAKDLPSVAELEDYQPNLVTQVYARHGELIADFFIERRFLVPLNQMPQFIRQATVAVEDVRFYTHGGADLVAVLRAMWVNFRAGEVREGASTITQQVARTLFLTRERTIRRKLREIILAYRIERRYSKDQILEIYLNQIFYGHSAHGVEAAAQLYFGKSVQELTLGEAALIAGLPRAPNTYSPLNNLALSLQRRQHALRRMVEAGYITPDEARAAQAETPQVKARQPPVNQAPYFVEYVRRYLEEHYGATRLYRGGFEVHTTLDLRWQQAADRALRHGLLAVDKRHGYQGPKQRLKLTGDAASDTQQIRAVTRPADRDAVLQEGDVLPGVVLEVGKTEVTVAIRESRGVLKPEGFNWVRKANLQQDFRYRRLLKPEEIFTIGDVIGVRVLQVNTAGQAHLVALEQEPLVQGALLAMGVGSGQVLAMSGGYDFAASQFNRAIQALRQPGSSFKPIIYAAALDAGMTPASVIIDAPIIKKVIAQAPWKPQNYSRKFYGPTTLRTALTHSRNLVTIRLLNQIGVPAVLAYAKQLGISSPLAPYLSLALGSSGLTLAELTSAYGVFASGGMYTPPVFITRVIDAQGNVLETHFPEAWRASSAEMAYVMTSLLEGVIKHGTGRRVRELGRPAAGKTGTTNDFRDAWFVGFTPQVIAGVWVGMDDHTTLGHRETGGRAASPIWLAFMREVTRGRPITDFAIPPGVRFVRIEAQSGLPAAVSTQADTVFEAFVDGTQPRVVAPSSSHERRHIRRLDRQLQSVSHAPEAADASPHTP